MGYRNPNANAKSTAVEEAGKVYFEYGRVVDAKNYKQGEKGNHIVTVKPYGKDVRLEALVAVGAKGDRYVPPQDDIVESEVLIARRAGEFAVVIGSIYTEDGTFDSKGYKPGERGISHPLTDAEIFINKSGAMRIENDFGQQIRLEDNRVIIESDGGKTVEVNDSQVIIDGGTQGIITDVTGSDTTGSGDIDTLNITRDNDILI